MSAAMPDLIEGVQEETFLAPTTPWQVVVSNDPVNLIPLVAVVFQKVLKISKDLAMTYTLKVHLEGRCVVFTGTQEECQAIAEKLMSYQLWTHVEKAA